MKLNIKHSVESSSLSPHRKHLLPLFEAVVNSIHAIQEAKNTRGCIHITVEREVSKQDNLIQDVSRAPVSAFTIVDNGIGFDAKNYESFDTSYTDHKAWKGGKGIGRITWLKAFDKVAIKSVFRENGSYKERTFDFVKHGEGIEHPKLRVLENGSKPSLQTEVKLIGYKPAYQKFCPKPVQAIADRLLEHCLIFFLSPTCPSITISDDKESVNLNELFAASNHEQETFIVKGEVFKIVHLKRYSTREKTNKIHLCANERTVYSRDIDKTIPDVRATLTDSDGNSFKYAAVVWGKYLDDHVNQERTAFDFSDHSGIDPQEEFFEDDEISRDEIEGAALNKTKEFLSTYLQPVVEDKLAKIKNHIETVTPNFRPVLAYKLDRVLELRPDLSPTELTAALHRIYSDLEVEITQRAENVIKGNITDETKYEEVYTNLVHELSDFSKAELAQHVIHRKLILDLFENILHRKADGRYSTESIVHELIFPMRTSSASVFEEQQNLWIVDEKLYFHRFLASDLRFNEMGEVIDSSSKDRPDVVIFNKIALTADESPHDSVVILEFKQPMRERYDDKKEENPIQQVYRYIDDIKEGKIKDDHDRLITLKPNALFFAYILCDPTPKIEEYARQATFKRTPDNSGWFNFNENYPAWVEIIPFNKLLSDAKKRNRILFKKLNLPYF
ncbi:MAG TPA: ATP-binding protein [Pyrinomonadaceae bacterium]